MSTTPSKTPAKRGSKKSISTGKKVPLLATVLYEQALVAGVLDPVIVNLIAERPPAWIKRHVIQRYVVHLFGDTKIVTFAVERAAAVYALASHGRASLADVETARKGPPAGQFHSLHEHIDGKWTVDVGTAL